MALVTLSDNTPLQNFQSGEQGCGSVTFVIVGPSSAAPLL